LATIAAAAGLAFFYLSQSSHVAAVGYEIDDLQAQVASLRAEQQQLVLQIGLAQAPTTILSEATRQLKLRPLNPSSVSFAHRASPTPSTRPSPEPAH
jgi:cell division protein FtsL